MSCFTILCGASRKRAWALSCSGSQEQQQTTCTEEKRDEPLSQPQLEDSDQPILSGEGVLTISKSLILN